MRRHILAATGILLLLIANGGLALATNHTADDTDLPPEELCDKDVAEAEDMNYSGVMCTQVIQTLQCPHDDDITHEARNGCIASSLKKMNWTAVESDDIKEATCEKDVQRAKEAAADRECTQQTMHLRCPDNPDYTYQAANGCEISTLEEADWIPAKRAEEPREPPEIPEPPENPREPGLEQRVERLEMQVQLLRAQVEALKEVIEEEHADADVEANVSDSVKKPPIPGDDESIANRSTGPPERPDEERRTGPPKGLLGRLGSIFG